jgi:hypothetical protein
MKTNTLHDKLNQKLNEFEVLGNIEPSVDWNEEFMAKLAHSKTTTNNISASKITTLMLFFAVINICFFVTVINTKSKESDTSNIRKEALQNISYELLSNQN